MGNSDIRKPTQKRSIETKEKIIKYGFDLICQKGYYNTNTSEIAKAANVSTGIVYSYFHDKHDILIEGIKKYSDYIFYPMINNEFKKQFENTDIKIVIKNVINNFIDNHKLTSIAHEEIMAMVHLDKEIANFYHQRELKLTSEITELLLKSGYKGKNLSEKVHISIGLIDNLCHEIVYHKHPSLDYNSMTNIVVEIIYNMVNKNT